jgi:TolB-like protein
MNGSSDERPDPSGRFLDEIRRRHVVRTALAYAAVVFVVLQLAEIVLPAFRTGVQADAIIRVLVVGAVLLLPVVLAAAWVWEITPRGIRSMAELDAEAGIESRGSLAHRGAFLAVTAVAVAGAGVWWWQTDEGLVGSGEGSRSGRERSGMPAFVAATVDDQGPIGSLAVLPLDDLSPEGSGEDYFVLGMHEALLSEVSRISGLRVVSRTSVVQLSQEGKSIPRIGRELGVDAIVEGSVLRDGERVRITVQLIHAASDTHLWAESYERDLTDIITLQSEVARAITAEIQAQVESRLQGQEAAGAPVQVAQLDGESASGPAPGEGPGGPAPPVAAEVQEAVMRGRVFLFDRDGWPTSTPDGADTAAQDDLAFLEAAEGSFREALAMDSAFVPALSGLAGALLMQGMEAGAEGRNQVRAAEDLAFRALELDPRSEEAAEIVEGARSALAQLERVGLDSTVLPLPLTALGMEIQRSLAEAGVRTPRDSRHQVRAVLRLIASGRLEQAVEVGESLLEEGVDDPLLFEAVEQGYRVTGSLDEVPGLVERRDGSRAAGEVEARIDQEGLAGYWSWKTSRIAADQAADRRVSPTVVATSRMASGDTEGALAELEEALAGRDPLLALVRHDATWDPIRATRAFQETMRTGREQLQAVPPRPPGG